MDKVICEICGTTFPDDADKCPLCGCSRDFLLEDMGDAFPAEEAVEYAASVSRKKNKVFDFDEVNQEKPARKVQVEDDVDDDDDEEEEEEEPRTNVFLVVILVILIVLLLLAAGFFYLRYFLPNMKDEPAQTEPVATTMAIETEPAETEDLGIPCTNLMMDGGKMELGEGGKKLLNVHVYPEDTTDAVTYMSADESIVTVSEDGTVTAVGEGTTFITVTCGNQQIKCNVTVDYDATEVTVSNETIPAPTVENTDETQAAEATEASEATEATEVTEATEETVPAGTELKLKKSDITIGSNYTSVRLEMDCEIKPEDVKWFTMDSTIAIVHDGVVTSTGSGMTRIYGEYEGQQVMCIVRCIF